MITRRTLLAASALAPAAAKKRDRRLIVNWDQMNMWALQLTYAHRGRTPQPSSVKTMLEAIADEHAKANIDCVVQCVFALPRGTVGPGFRSFHRENTLDFKPYGEPTGIRELEQAGGDWIQILLERCHSRGVEYLAGLRMNDRHGGSASGVWARAHQDWMIDGIAGGMDYKHQGVRQAVLDFAKEFLDRYDVDGIELDWMRWCHMFKPSEAEASAPILNGFMAEMRRILDEAGRKRGRRLILGARVPQTLEECRMLGYDVRTWARRALTDFLCPSDFFHTDFNIRMEDFAAITKGTRCKLFPSLHPWIARGNDFHVHTAESYRAAANNYYAYGADGISLYNYQYHWRTDIAPETEWPRALGYVSSLGEKKSIRTRDRRYLFHPIWPKGAPTGVSNYQLIGIEGGKQSGSTRIRVAEEPRMPMELEFKVTGMSTANELEISLNGRAIPPGKVSREFVSAGQTAKQGRVLPPFYRYRAPFSAPEARFGENELAVRLTAGRPGQAVIVQEIEVIARAAS
ncbi:MAG: hypothetical protein FJW39_27770 [Acidobacteria bacterium]|nr:hypothetical protein [Acidobacteriota bacterium]